MRAVDTNVLVRLIARDDSRQAASAEAFIQPGAWVLNTNYGLSSKGSAKAIEMLLNHRDLTLQDPETVAAALELFRAKPTLGFSDCLMLQLARKAGHLPLGAFGRNLARVDGAQKL
jgi:predicted nucleic-acid-binding protein